MDAKKDGMASNARPFTQYDDNISPTQEDNGGNGAGDAPIQDNGTRDANFSAGGMRTVSKVDYPLPPDPHAPPGQIDGGDAEVADFGLNEKVEVGFDGGVHDYGLTSGEVGAKDGSIEDQAFSPNKAAGGGKPENIKQ